MPVFRVGETHESEEPTIEVTITNENPLSVGAHEFQLIVVDEAGNESVPETAVVRVIDSQNPTAILTAPAQVPLGEAFRLDGRRSRDVPPGRITRFRWTLVR